MRVMWTMPKALDFGSFLLAFLVVAAGLASHSAQAEDRHAASAVSVSHGASDATVMRFEVVSIRPSKPGTNLAQGPGLLPNGFRQTGLNMWMIIMMAYNPNPVTSWGSAKLLNAPGWVGQDMYDIDARIAPEDVEAWRKQDMAHPPVLLRGALREMLKERCHLALHPLPSTIPYLDLVVGKHGLKIKETPPGEALPEKGFHFGDGIMTTQLHNGTLEHHLYGVTMLEFAAQLNTLSPDRPIQDKTGLPGRYDFVWRQEDSQSNQGDPEGELAKWPIANLGLALVPGVGPATTFVVDHIDKPSPN